MERPVCQTCARPCQGVCDRTPPKSPSRHGSGFATQTPRRALQESVAHMVMNAEAGDDPYTGQLEPMPALSELAVLR